MTGLCDARDPHTIQAYWVARARHGLIILEASAVTAAAGAVPMIGILSNFMCMS